IDRPGQHGSARYRHRRGRAKLGGRRRPGGCSQHGRLLMTTGPGLYFDGASSARHPVTVMAAPESLRILGPDGAMIVSWPYPDLRSQPAPDDVMRLRRAGSGPELARLEIRDTALIAAIGAFASSLDRS